jgi:uncharacterized cupredoxin-like copper-binding protein
MKKQFLLLGVIALIFASCSQNQESNDQNAQLDLQSVGAINSPQSPLTVGCKHNIIQNEKGGEILYEDGSKIYFPEKAFVYEDGSTVTGEVEINFTTYNNSSAIVSSELPMSIIEDGKLEVFESAGMFTVQAKKNGKNLKLASGKTAEVVTKSTKQGEFNFYKLAEDAKTWTEINQQIIATTEAPATDGLSYPMDSITLDIVKPTAPRKASGKEMVFNLKIDQKEIPELAQFENLMWQLDKGYEGKEWLFENKWDKVKIEQIVNEPGKYLMEINEKGKTSEVKILPVLMGTDFELALKNYNKEMAKYKKRLAELETTSPQFASQYSRTASLQDLGTYNWDRLMKQPESMIVTARFVVPNQQLNDERVVHMISGQEKQVVNFQQNGKANFRFSPVVENTLLCIGADSMLYYQRIVLSPEQIRNAKSETQYFYLKSAGEKIHSLADVQAFIDRI